MNKLYIYILAIIVLLYILNRYISTEEKVVLKDYLDGCEGEMYGENKGVLSSYKTAWTEDEISKNTKYHTSNIEGEKTNGGDFFKNNIYVDTTTPYSKDVLPEGCSMEDDNIVCSYNNRLHNIPPTLIEDPGNNLVLNSIGDDKKVNTNTVSEEVYTFNGNNYNVWEYGEDDKLDGYNPVPNGNPLVIKDVKVNYAL
ncbi:MAG: hypothetical protein CL779_03100 [Chloroflexi bacterium]|nr:hypothetical protein [Chloroflexota bacterium]|tara:strand:- start:67 stop:657 length:591 start_codon:yes stop_codon:yes gene_type:complete